MDFRFLAKWWNILRKMEYQEEYNQRYFGGYDVPSVELKPRPDDKEDAISIKADMVYITWNNREMTITDILGALRYCELVGDDGEENKKIWAANLGCDHQWRASLGPRPWCNVCGEYLDMEVK